MCVCILCFSCTDGVRSPSMCRRLLWRWFIRWYKHIVTNSHVIKRVCVCVCVMCMCIDMLLVLISSPVSCAFTPPSPQRGVTRRVFRVSAVDSSVWVRQTHTHTHIHVHKRIICIYEHLNIILIAGELFSSSSDRPTAACLTRMTSVYRWRIYTTRCCEYGEYGVCVYVTMYTRNGYTMASVPEVFRR